MKIHRGIVVLLLTLFASGRSIGGEAPCCEPVGEGILQQFHPVGGWHPYGGGLLHWWPRDCFPCCGGPDDYCRKPLPRVCWPPYPPYYTWGPPQICCPPNCSCPDCNKLH